MVAQGQSISHLGVGVTQKVMMVECIQLPYHFVHSV